MNEYPVLVKPLEECPEEYETCFNCGSNLMRVLNKWVILKDKYCVTEGIPKITLGSIDFYCAICGKLVSGHGFVENKNIETMTVGDGEQVIVFDDFGTKEEAEDHLRYLEEKGMIIDSHKGILWVYNPSPKLKKAIENAREI